MQAPIRAAFALAMALAIATGGCSTSTAGNANKPQASEPPVYVNVVNSNWNTVRIYAIRGASKHRLGTVTTNATSRFEIPEYLYTVGGHVTLRVEPIGSSESFESGPIPAEPGARIEWRVRNILYYSSTMVY